MFGCESIGRSYSVFVDYNVPRLTRGNVFEFVLPFQPLDGIAFKVNDSKPISYKL